MSETLSRHRPSVDLDDFERRLHEQSASRPHEDDPLAELARLVGEQHDPYGDVFAQEAVAHPASAALDDHRADGRREPAFGGLPRFPADFAAIEAGLRGAIPAHAEPQLAHPQFQDPQPQDPQFQDQQYQDPQYHDTNAYSADLHDQPDQGYAPEPEWRQPQRESRSRKPIYAMVATIAVGIVGIGVAFAYKGASSSPREIKTIMAAAGPTKIQPPADQTADEAGADAVAQQTPTKLVSREEQPVDLPQAVQDNAARDAASQKADADSVPVPLSPAQQQDASTGAVSPDYSALAGGGDAAQPAQPAANARDGFGVGMGSPKKVKVVSVRPDGTILRGGDAAPAEADPAPPSVSERAEPVVPTSTPRTVEPKPAPKPGKTTSRVTAPPPADADADAAAAPKPVKSAHKPKPVRVATNDTGDQEATDAAAPKATSGGGFAVQLAAPASEADARSATSRFLKKFGGALHGRRLGFHRADSNGKTVYRVRVSSLSREDATSLCEKLKADGGTCFVAKN